MIKMGYKNEFIRFMAECDVLRFGDFTLKSGRKAPYFINAGNYRKGSHLARLGEFYADCINANGIKADKLFGPAYCFDRKEVKDHGEGGMFVGDVPSDGDRIIIIDDVMTSGKALKESYPKITGAAKVDIAAMVITVDRMEKGTGELSAVQEVKQEFGITVYPIVTMQDIIDAI